MKYAGNRPYSDPGLQHAIGQGWLEYHESGTFVRMIQLGKNLSS